jgi:NADP-dependent 3-hydroxy acid dehydrogenase YdfG
VKSFESAVAVVTGAGSGIGRELTKELARRGARVAACDVDDQALGETAETCSTGSVSTHRVDVRDAEAMRETARSVIDTYAQVDLLINNAGIISRPDTVLDQSMDEMRLILDVSYWGVVNGTRAYLPALLERPEAAIVNLSSALGLAAVPLLAPYVAAKFAVRGYSDALRCELAGTNVTVTCVHPGVIATDLGKNAPADSEEERARRDEFHRSFARTSAPQAARAILEGVVRRRPRVVIGADGRLADLLCRLLPGSYPKILSRFARRSLDADDIARLDRLLERRSDLRESLTDSS